jgi:hypothetical protein
VVIAALTDFELTLIVGVATAVGAAVGGAITAVVALKAEERRDESAQRLEDRRDSRQDAHDRQLQRTAARLIQDDLIRARATLGIINEHRVAEGFPLRAASWSSQREQLSRGIDDVFAWSAVIAACSAIETLADLIDGPCDGTVTDAIAQQAVNVQADVDAALGALRPLVGVAPQSEIVASTD